MASSSVSQESLDTEDFQLVSQRRSRVRPGLRCRAPIKDQAMDGAGAGGAVADDARDEAADAGGGDHDSPTRGSARGKEKRGRPLHLYKGKTAKEKRKLREKRRSTGVLHFPTSTESTGDSLDEDEKGEAETRRNTSYNEVIDADNPQTPEEARNSFVARSVRNKSPSDLEADLEDNQDYDSTVSQSETNLTIIGQSSSSSSSSSAHKFGSCTSPPETTKPRSGLAQGREEIRGRSLYASRFGIHPQGDVGRPRPLGGGVHGHTAAQEVFRQSANTKDTRSERLRSDAPANRNEVGLVTKNIHLAQQLEQEREETRRLREILEARDKKIAQLENEVALLNKNQH